VIICYMVRFAINIASRSHPACAPASGQNRTSQFSG